MRSTENRVVAGVAAGIGDQLHIDPAIIRAAFVVLSLAGGAGVVLYLVAWMAFPEALGTSPRAEVKSGMRQLLGISSIVGGLLLFFRGMGLWFGDAVVWPAAVAVLGATVIWVRSDQSESSRFRRVAARVTGNPLEAIITGQRSSSGVVLGTALTVAGTAIFLAANTSLQSVSNLVFPVAVTVAGLGLIFGPWLARLARQASDERRERIRSQERSEMAAHLHDSVLQTLALIQRADSPRRMASLARTQERELRAWLYGRTGTLGEDSLRSAIDALAGRVEQAHQVRVEAVVVGDIPLDERCHALVKACGEAMINGAKHSGAQELAVYVEVEANGIVAYIRDEGRGFDVDGVPADRHGIAESIRGRMERSGGTFSINSKPGHGTEVQLRLPRSMR